MRACTVRYRPTRNSFARAAGEPVGEVGGVVGGGLDVRGRTSFPALGVGAAGGLEPGALGAQPGGGGGGGQRVDVQGEVEAAGPGQQRFQPRRADLGRVAGDREGGRVAVTDAQIPRGQLDGGGRDRTRRPAGCRRRVRRCWCAGGQAACQVFFSAPVGAAVMTASGGAMPPGRGGR